MLQPLLRRTWAKRGCTPTLTAWDRHDRLTCIAALTVNPKTGRIGQYFKIQRHNAKADDFLMFLFELKKQLRRPIIVIWDRLSAHRRIGRAFRELEWKGVRFEYLPAYSPELNPVVSVHWPILEFSDLASIRRVGFCVRSTIPLVRKDPHDVAANAIYQSPNLETTLR